MKCCEYGPCCFIIVEKYLKPFVITVSYLHTASHTARIMTVSLVTFSMTLSIRGLFTRLSIITLSKFNTHPNNTMSSCFVPLCQRFIYYYAECNCAEYRYGEYHYAECCYAILFIVMLMLLCWVALRFLSSCCVSWLLTTIILYYMSLFSFYLSRFTNLALALS